MASYNLPYNAALMVKENVAAALALDNLANTSEAEQLKFFPLNPGRIAGQSIAWKKGRESEPSGFSAPLQKFLEEFRTEVATSDKS